MKHFRQQQWRVNSQKGYTGTTNSQKGYNSDKFTKGVQWYDKFTKGVCLMHDRGDESQLG